MTRLWFAMGCMGVAACGASADEPVAKIEVPDEAPPGASTKVASSSCWVTLNTCNPGDIIRGSGPGTSSSHDCTCTSGCTASKCSYSCDSLYVSHCASQ